VHNFGKNSVKILRRLKWNVDHIFWKIKTGMLLFFRNIHYDIFKPYWINPKLIVLSLIPDHMSSDPDKRTKPVHEIGRIADGDWDLKTMPFEELDVFQSFKAHFIDGVNWNDTELYTRITSYFKRGSVRSGCASIEEFNQKLDDYENLYQSILKNGYRLQTKIKSSRPFGNEDEIIVHIARDGDYIFANGRHRLAVVKLLDIDSVAVKVGKRHKKWVEFRKEVLSYAETYGGFVSYPLMHHDLEDIPSAHGWTAMNLIEPYIKKDGGNMLDIGAHWGFFCHNFEKAGYKCTAVENDPENLYFLKKLHRAGNCRFKVLETGILDINLEKKYDAVVAFNVFHGFLKEKRLYDQFVLFLEKSNCTMLFFQLFPDAEASTKKGIKEYYMNYSEMEFVNFVKEKGNFSKAVLIGNANGSGIYKFEH
jgi:2-polyprenyl-3-methyl-5-hydroxy-6-metoxy-1,4-benzoquinol methylase